MVSFSMEMALGDVVMVSNSLFSFPLHLFLIICYRLSWIDSAELLKRFSLRASAVLVLQIMQCCNLFLYKMSIAK